MSARAYLLPDFPVDAVRKTPRRTEAPRTGFTTIDVIELPNGFWEVRGDRGLFGGRFRSSEQALRFAIEEGRTYRAFVLQMKSRPLTEH